MLEKSRLLVIFTLSLFLLSSTIHVRPASGQPNEPAGTESGNSIELDGYEAVVGVTLRTQALLVFDGGKKTAVMTGNFVPTPQIFLNTPFRPFKSEEMGRDKNTRSGYYLKYSYNRFSLDRQEDPDTGGIGPSSPVYNYGTEVKGYFLAVAPVVASEILREDGTLKFRIEFGLGLGYLDLEGDIVLGDWQGDPLAPRTQIDYSGLSYFLFAMGRHQWGSFMFGYQMGISATDSKPYSYSQSYVSLDFGYRIVF